MNEWIDEYYPGTQLAISAWNFGAQDTMNGALTIAEVLGVFGQEELLYASFFPEIERDTPAFHAFKMFTNYDGIGGTYGDLAVEAVSSHPEAVSAYSSIDLDTGNLHIILINRVEKVQQFRQKSYGTVMNQPVLVRFINIPAEILRISLMKKIRESPVVQSRWDKQNRSSPFLATPSPI